jgi:hypothetical protein
VATRSLKRGEVWRIDFKKKRGFSPDNWAVLPFGLFGQEKRAALQQYVFERKFIYLYI